MAGETLSDQNFWLRFFIEAGIPEQDAITYAFTFEENRIQHSHLMDLSRDILTEMGINKVGDTIAIMKHAKEVHEKDKQKQLMGPHLSLHEDNLVSSSHSSPAHMTIWRVSPKYEGFQTALSRNKPVEEEEYHVPERPDVNEIAEEEGGEYYVIPEGDVQLDQDKTKFSENQPQVVNNDMSVESPFALQRRVLSAAQKLHPNSRPQTSEVPAHQEASSGMVFRRLGQKSSASKYYLDAVTQSKKGKTKDDSVFVRLSKSNENRQELSKKSFNASPSQKYSEMGPSGRVLIASEGQKSDLYTSPKRLPNQSTVLHALRQIGSLPKEKVVLSSSGSKTIEEDRSPLFSRQAKAQLAKQQEHKKVDVEREMDLRRTLRQKRGLAATREHQYYD